MNRRCNARNGRRGWLIATILAIAVCCSRENIANGQILSTEVPEAAQGIGVDSKLGETIDLDLQFHDDRNQLVRLGDFFDGRQPVMLSFNYSNCPKLCSVQLENMVLTLGNVKFKVHNDFQLISVSIDALEQVSRARDTKDKYALLYGVPESNDGFHFLVGSRNAIGTLADSCGVRYKYIPNQKLYSHPPVFILLSPTGKIVRYIHGLDYEWVTIERALIEAAEGKIGSPINRFTYITGCFMYDDMTGKYTAQWLAIMRIGGGLTVIALVVGLVPYWLIRRKSFEPGHPLSADKKMPVGNAKFGNAK
jgi:protein SCO1/2